MLGLGESEKTLVETEAKKEEVAAPLKMTGVKKFKKLIKNPIKIAGTVYKDEEFSIDISALKKMNKNLTVQIERSIELKMIKPI